MNRRCVAAASMVIALVATACGGSDGEETDAGSETTTEAATSEATTTTAAAITSTTEAATTTAETAAGTTTTAAGADEEPGVADLRLVGIEDADLTAISDGYQVVFGPSDPPAGDNAFLPYTCAGALEYESFQRVAYGYVYPVQELGFPDDGVVYDIIHVAHQVVIGDATLAADVAERTSAGCPVTYDRDESQPIEAIGTSFDSPRLAGIDDASGFAIALGDGNVYLQYTFTVDDLGATLHMVGAAPGEFEDLQALAEPIVELAQSSLLDCLDTPACRDANA